jgi:hypothetical protein
MRKRRRLLRFGGLLLAASTAAARFVMRPRSAGGVHNGWRPIVLYWRRRRRRPQPDHTSRVAVAAQTVWLPQFHFHFLAPAGKAFHCWRTMVPPAVSVLPTMQVFVNRHSTIVRLAPLAVEQRRAHRSQRAVILKKDGSRIIPASTHVRRLVAESGRPVCSTPTVGYPTRGSIVERLHRGHAAMMSDRKLPLNERRLGRRLTYARQLSLVRQHIVAQASALDAHRSAQRQVRSYRPVDITWLRSVSSEASPPEPRPHAAVSTSLGSASFNAGESQKARSSSVSGAAQATHVRVTDLDPRLVERLADDVIRRVERRVRIERERRGL